MRGTSERSAREQVQVPNVMLYCSKVNLLINTLNVSVVFITLLQFGDVYTTSFGAQYVFFLAINVVNITLSSCQYGDIKVHHLYTQ